MESISTDTIIHNEHCHAIKKILIIEDTTYLLNAISNDLIDSFAIVCDTAENEVQAMSLLDKNDYDLIICDLYLPDSSGNFIGYLLRKKHKLLIITASEDEDQRLKLTELPIIDYLYKSDAKSIIKYINNTVARLISNQKSYVVICDDSKLSRMKLIQIIKCQNIQYIQFDDGLKAYNFIINTKIKINLLITDIYMPHLDGINLTRKIRLKYDENELPILSFSASTNISLVPKILKSGANDFITKPIYNEEFLTRFNACLDRNSLYTKNIELLKRLNELATTDNLTKLYNRNFFYSTISHIVSNAERKKTHYGVLMIDIDNFKNINDTCGHSNGDIVLFESANILKLIARDSDLIFRWGGEEFLILIQNTNLDDLLFFSERVRSNIESTCIELPDYREDINITISIGVSINENYSNIDNVINQADKNLYLAKNSGKNQVIYRALDS
ncbi:diguanylate cyclase [Sulfurimonas sp.]|nr:diguanylate cyclase [Sulfurimonas sp.]